MNEPDAANDDLAELLEETRILLPGSEVLVAFLISLPFTERFELLTLAQRVVFLATFFSALTALVCFVMPAAYHRLARPIRDKGAFKVLANRFLVAGLVPLSCSLVLATYLVTSMASTHLVAIAGSAVVFSLILVLWWVLPLIRAHRALAKASNERGPGRRGAEGGGVSLQGSGKSRCSPMTEEP